ncbi:MAG TPA: DUF3298 domain-containing protein [Pyrinomonadaceae bacterium]
MNLRTCLLIACLAVSFGCRKTSTPPPTAPPPGTATPSPELSHVAGGETPAPQTKYFKGSIGSSLDLQMKLVRTGDQLTGSYFYQKIGARINLRGNVDKDGNLTLEEFDQAGKQTGLFKGIWTVDASDGLISLAGNWSKPPGEKGSDKKTAFSVHEEPIAFTGDVEIVSKQIKESNKKLMYEISVQYPQITGGTNPNFEKFNQAARASVTRKVAGFKKDVQPTEGEEEPRPEGSMGSDLSVSYDVVLAQDDLVSVKFVVSSYFQGAAHPNSYSDVLNFDLKNGKQLKLGDLFKPGAKFLQTIATSCIGDLKKQAKDLPVDQIEEGAAAKSDNYGSWTITRRGLGITFDAYQVAPYAAGPQFVLVPYSTLKDLINPEGPVAQFAK